MARATNSLPVPLSPSKRIVESLAATLATNLVDLMHARTFTYHRMLQIHFVPQPLVFLFEPLQVTRIFQHGGGDRRYDHTCAGGPRRSRKLPLPTEERASFWLTTPLLESAKPSRSTRSVICLQSEATVIPGPCSKPAAVGVSRPCLRLAPARRVPRG